MPRNFNRVRDERGGVAAVLGCFLGAAAFFAAGGIVGMYHQEGKDAEQVRQAGLVPGVTPSPTVTVTVTATPTPTETTSPTPTKTPKPIKKAPLIVLDPGHDGITKDTIDPATGIKMKQYPNIPEMKEVFRAAKLVQLQLEQDGYRVMLTKTSAKDSATYRERAQVAIDNDADLQVMIHNDHSQLPSAFQHTYAPPLHGYRVGTKGKVSCENQQVVKESLAAAKAIATARSEAQGIPTTLGRLTFDSRPGFAPGNISAIQLFDCLEGVPSVYNEAGAQTEGNTTTPIPKEALEAYATGIANGIEAAVPIE